MPSVDSSLERGQVASCSRIELGTRAVPLVGFGGQVLSGLDSSSEDDEFEKKKVRFVEIRKQIEADRMVTDLLEAERKEERRKRLGLGLHVIMGRGASVPAPQVSAVSGIVSGGVSVSEVVDSSVVPSVVEIDRPLVGSVVTREEFTGGFGKFEGLKPGKITEVRIEERLLEKRLKGFSRWDQNDNVVEEEMEWEEIVGKEPVGGTFVSPATVESLEMGEERKQKVQGGIKKVFEELAEREEEADIVTEWCAQAADLI